MGGTLTTRVTHLEMHTPPAQRVHPPLGFKLALMRAEAIPVHFYRYLYEQIGRAHHWQLRRTMNDAELEATLHAATTHVEVLYCDGAPAGFFELDLAAMPETAEIKYFGIVPSFQGRGLSRFLLSAAVFQAWSARPGAVTIETNTLDSPRALQLYQKIGFAPTAWWEETIEAWD